MPDAQQLIQTAKLAFKRRDFAAALAALQALDLSSVDLMFAIRIMMAQGEALHALGRSVESAAQFRETLAKFVAADVLTPQTATMELLDLAMMIAIGARDLPALENLMKFSFPDFFSTPHQLKISQMAEIKAWCMSAGIKPLEHHAGQDITLDQTAGPDSIYRYTAEACWSVVIPGAEIIPGWDFVISPAGVVLHGANYAPLDCAYPFLPHCIYVNTGELLHVWSAEAITIEDDALFMNCPESFHFGHWLVDFLPRLMAWRLPGHETQKLAIPANLPTKHREALAYFGVKPTDLIECAFAQRHRFRSLTVVSNGLYLNPNPKRITFVGNALACAPGPLPAGQPGRRLFLTRAVGTRSVANAEAFQALLDEFGIETVDLAALTLAQQNNIFRDTEMVMGVFGSDLLAAYQLRPGTALIELIWNIKDDPIIIRTCAILGLRHHFEVAQVAPQAQKKRRKMDVDIVVNVDTLRQRLTTTLNPR